MLQSNPSHSPQCETANRNLWRVDAKWYFIWMFWFCSQSCTIQCSFLKFAILRMKSHRHSSPNIFVYAHSHSNSQINDVCWHRLLLRLLVEKIILTYFTKVKIVKTYYFRWSRSFSGEWRTNSCSQWKLEVKNRFFLWDSIAPSLTATIWNVKSVGKS